MKKYNVYRLFLIFDFLLVVSFILLKNNIVGVNTETSANDMFVGLIIAIFIELVILIVQSRKNKMSVLQYLSKIKKDNVEQKNKVSEIKLVCKKCNSNNINIQIVNEKKSRSCLSVFFWIILAICTFGIVLLIPLLRGTNSKSKKYYVCQNCGHTWQ